MNQVRAAFGIQRRLPGDEGLGADDEERLGGRHPGQHVGQLGAVDVGDVVDLHVRRAVLVQRLDGHDEPEVRTADADVDDVADPRAGSTPELARADGISQGQHALALRLDLQADIRATHQERRTGGSAQRHVLGGTVLGGVHHLAGEQRLDPARHLPLAREGDQQLEGVGREAVAGEIQQAVAVLAGEEPRSGPG